MREPGRCIAASLDRQAATWTALVALALGTACGPPGEAPRPRNAILVVIDTLRADRMSVYGAERVTTPALERLATERTVFEQAVTNATWTLPAMAGLLAGRYVDGRVLDARLRTSLVERLEAAGFATAAFTGGGFVSRRYGFERGFETFREEAYANPLGNERARARRDEHDPRDEIGTTFARAARWLAEHGREPFFLLMHTYEPHTPYLRDTYAESLDPGGLPPRFGVVAAAFAKRGEMALDEGRLRYIRALYDGGVRESDRQVGRLLDRLERLGLADDTLVLVTSDHGDDLGDRSPPAPGNHGHNLFDEQALVPLIVRDPTLPTTVSRVGAQVRTIDIVPTILDRLGVDPGPGVTGRSLAPLMTGAEQKGRPAWMRSIRNTGSESIAIAGLRTRDRKLVVDASAAEPGEPPRIALFDLEADPGERHDLSRDRPAELRALLETYRGMRERVETHGVPRFHLDAPSAGEQAERLRALGYIE